MSIDPISKAGMGFCLFQIDEYWERFERKGEGERMKKIILVLLGLMMLSGCAISLSPEFSTKAKEDLGMSPIIYYRADWIHGVYGYPSFAEALASKVQITRGALVVDDEKIAFVRFDKQIQKYDYIFQLKYLDVTEVRVFKKGLSRRLVLKTGSNNYTLEIVKGAVIDREQTYKFAAFIADKLGKDSSDFSKELAKEEKKEVRESIPKEEYLNKELPKEQEVKSSEKDDWVTVWPVEWYYHKFPCTAKKSNFGSKPMKIEDAIKGGYKPCPYCIEN